MGGYRSDPGHFRTDDEWQRFIDPGVFWGIVTSEPFMTALIESTSLEVSIGQGIGGSKNFGIAEASVQAVPMRVVIALDREGLNLFMDASRNAVIDILGFQMGLELSPKMYLTEGPAFEYFLGIVGPGVQIEPNNFDSNPDFKMIIGVSAYSGAGGGIELIIDITKFERRFAEEIQRRQ